MKQKGFTLIELIFVIVIIGILAAIALPKFAGLTGKANTAQVEALAANLSSAAAADFATNGVSACAAVGNMVNPPVASPYAITAVNAASGICAISNGSSTSPASAQFFIPY